MHLHEAWSRTAFQFCNSHTLELPDVEFWQTDSVIGCQSIWLVDIDMLRIKKKNQRPGQSIKVLLKEVIQLPVSVVCRDYTNVLMAFRACWMGSDPALVRMGPGCTWSFSIHGPHQCEVSTVAPRRVKQCASRGEPLKQRTSSNNNTCCGLSTRRDCRHDRGSLHQAIYLWWFIMIVFTFSRIGVRITQYLHNPLLWLFCSYSCVIHFISFHQFWHSLSTSFTWHISSDSDTTSNVCYCDREANN